MELKDGVYSALYSVGPDNAIDKLSYAQGIIKVCQAAVESNEGPVEYNEAQVRMHSLAKVFISEFFGIKLAQVDK